MEGFDQKEVWRFVDTCTSSFRVHKAIPGVAKVVDGRMVRYLAKFLDFDHVHVLGFHVVPFDVSPLFVFMHIFIL